MHSTMDNRKSFYTLVCQVALPSRVHADCKYVWHAMHARMPVAARRVPHVPSVQNRNCIRKAISRSIGCRKGAKIIASQTCTKCRSQCSSRPANATVTVHHDARQQLVLEEHVWSWYYSTGTKGTARKSRGGANNTRPFFPKCLFKGGSLA